MPNVRTKGQEGEREIAREMNAVLATVLRRLARTVPETPIIQRNQNQSACGGSDLTNTFHLAIEIKRQEDLQINTWWKQCCDAAERSNQFPVLIYRQSGRKWRVIANMWLSLPSPRTYIDSRSAMQFRAEISFESFLSWFDTWAEMQLRDGYTFVL